MTKTDFLVHHARVAAEGGSGPARWMLVLHGIMGSGGNFRSIARKLTESAPSWGFVLVDLRAHGLSQGAAPPHTVAAAAEDLVRLERSIGLPIHGVMGHSFGGKVALAYLGLRSGELDQAWVLDAGAGAYPEERRTGSTSAVLRMLEEMPMPLPSRERFFEIVAEHGYDRALAEWLAMNVRRAEDGNGYRFRVDLTAIRALLTDYFERDLWPVLETPNASAGGAGSGAAREVHIVIAGRSTAVPEADNARYRALAAARPGAVFVHDMPNAGHWLHADDPEGLLAIIRPALAAP
jgi:pimeloyl-ACP methyl ester carboxylesterase